MQVCALHSPPVRCRVAQASCAVGGMITVTKIYFCIVYFKYTHYKKKTKLSVSTCPFAPHTICYDSFYSLSGLPFLFERSEFLIATSKKKKTDRLSGCSANLGFSVRSANRIRPKHGIPLPVKYIVFENTHTQIATADGETIATAASETEGVAAVSCMESHMNRRPLGSIDPNSIRETEFHTECRLSLIHI